MSPRKTRGATYWGAGARAERPQGAGSRRTKRSEEREPRRGGGGEAPGGAPAPHPFWRARSKAERPTKGEKKKEE